MADPAPTRTLVIFAQSERVIDQIYHGLDPRLTAGSYDRNGLLPAYALGMLGRGGGSGDVEDHTEHEQMPEQEYDCILRAWRIGEKHGYRVRLIDVTTESDFRAWIQKHLHGLKEFPVLLLPNGRRLSGPTEFTEERLQVALST